MTTQTSVRSPKYARGQHPNSRANLQPPWKKGENGGQHPGYPLKSRLKDALNRRMKVPELDAPAGDHLVYATLQGALLREPTPFKEVWDRTEGKVPEPRREGDESREAPIINIVVFSGESGEILSNLGRRLLGKEV